MQKRCIGRAVTIFQNSTVAFVYGNKQEQSNRGESIRIMHKYYEGLMLETHP